jgi:hypothetical protein
MRARGLLPYSGLRVNSSFLWSMFPLRRMLDGELSSHQLLYVVFLGGVDDSDGEALSAIRGTEKQFAGPDVAPLAFARCSY